MYLAEVPPPYAGGTLGIRGRIMQSLTVTTTPPTYEFYPLTPGPSGGYIPDQFELAILRNPNDPTLTLGLIANGEPFLVRFDYKGAWYLCYRIGTQLIFQSPTILVGLTQAGTTTPLPPGMNIPPVSGVSTIPGYTYQIMRMPKRIGDPLELPAGTCIDVAYSGVGPTNLPTGTLNYGMYPTPVSGMPVQSGLWPLQYITLMFAPGGGIDSLYLNRTPQPPSTTVHFMVGRTDKLNQPLLGSASSPTGLNLFDPTASNLADPLSLWVSVARSTGLVITSENTPPPIDVKSASQSNITIFPGDSLLQQQLNPQLPASQAIYLSFCRQLATNREQVRGQ